MFRKVLIPLLTLLPWCGFLFLLINATNCRKTVTRAVHGVFVCELSMRGSKAILFSDPIADTGQSEVSVVQDTVLYVFTEEIMFPGYLLFKDMPHLLAEEEYTVQLESNVGTCDGTVVMPGTITVLQPSYGDTLSAQDTVHCEWDSTPGATFYYLRYITYGHDSLGQRLKSYKDITTFVESTSYAIPPSYFDLPEAVSYEVSFELASYNGAFPEPGAPGNMSGSITGFLSAKGDHRYIRFFVERPSGKIVHRVKIPAGEESIHAYIEAMGMDRTVK